MTDTENKKGARILSLHLIWIGFIFLCTPNLNLFDILPDAIGYALLMFAIRRAGNVLLHFDTAYEKFRILFWINVAKIPAILIMTYISGIDLEERGLITVFALGFAVVEWIFAFPAMRALFEGFIYLGERNGVTAALRTPNGRSVDSLTILTVIFLSVKGATSFLPEFVFLSTFDHNGSLEIGAVNPAVFYPVLAAFGLLVSLCVGLVWLFSVKPYLKALEADAEMRSFLAKTAESLADELRAADEKRRHRFFLLFFSLGFVFAVDPLIGNRDLLPNALAAASFLLASRFSENEKLMKRGTIFSLIYLAVSLAENVFTLRFFQNFAMTDVAFKDVALGSYIPVIALRALEGVAFLLTIFCLAKLLKEFILTYTGKALRPQDLVLRNEVHTEFFARVKKLSLLGVLYAVARPVVAVLMTVTERHVITEDEANQFYAEGTTVYSPAFSWLWILVLTISALLAVYAVWLASDVKEEAEFEQPPERSEE